MWSNGDPVSQPCGSAPLCGRVPVGQRIAVPRHVPGPEQYDNSFSDEDVTAVARLVAELPEARVPSGLSMLPKQQIALFLREVFTRAGGVGLAATHPGGEIFCFADDRERLDRIALLLLRFGISSQVWGGGRDWVLDVVDLDSQRRRRGLLCAAHRAVGDPVGRASARRGL